jgi:PAS domain S-box-containing protein
MRRPVLAYAIGIAALTVAVALRWAIDPWLAGALPLVTLFGAVAAAQWVGGYRPAVLVTVLGYMACDYLFMDPRGHLTMDDLPSVVGLVAYLATCALIIAFGEAMRIARTQAAARRELLRVTLGSIGDAVITTDVQGRITYLNPIAEDLTGWTRNEAMNQPHEVVFRIVNEHSGEAVESPVARALGAGVAVELANHTALVRKDGSERPIEDSAAPIKDEEGELVGCVLIFRDVSKRRLLEAEEGKRLQDARMLASIVESSEDAIISKSLKGVIQSWNATAERVFGYPADEAIGRHISMVIPTERLAEEDLIMSRLRAGQRIEHFETVRVRKDGQSVRVSLTISPIKDDVGNVIGASKIVRDVTRQRATEELERRLREEANAKFRAFFEQGALFAGIMDVSGTMLESNRTSWEKCGYVKEQILGKRVWDGPWWGSSRELRDRIRAGAEQAASGLEFRAQLTYYVNGGGERFADLAILPIKNAAGEVSFLAMAGTDVTQRHLLEDHLRELASNLAQMDNRKNEFLATLAHELRNPLAPLANALELLKREGGANRVVQQTTSMMDRLLRHLVRLVDDLLDLSRITHNRLDLRKSTVELATVIDQAVEASRPLAEAAGHDLKVVPAPQPIYVDADAVRLTQVFGNLINNSCKYTAPGGRISVTTEAHGRSAVVTIADSGIGIPPEKLASIFDMFVQVDQSLEKSQGGLGIGLTLAKRLLELHGGSIDARSAGEGLGSEFIVRLPTVEAPRVATTPANSARVRRPGRRILVVDDNVDACTSLAMLLQVTGYETYMAHDGQAAFDAANKYRPDVMLLDIGLPKLNGYEVCRRLRKEPWGNGIALIALTGWGQDEDRRKSREAGFDGHLVKPVVSYESFIELVESLAEGRKAAGIPVGED